MNWVQLATPRSKVSGVCRVDTPVLAQRYKAVRGETQDGKGEKQPQMNADERQKGLDADS